MNKGFMKFYREIPAYAIMPETDSFHSLALAHDGYIYYHDTDKVSNPIGLWLRADDIVWRNRLEVDGTSGLRTGKFKIKVAL